ncbi:PLPL1 protein, partial [Steatornis caripensis]|nr:PLPL1 protein [Steatornis caripensis]
SFSILFRGCSCLIVYETGVLAALQELSPAMLNSASRIYGASSGSLVATFALCESDLGKAYALPFILCKLMRSLDHVRTFFWRYLLGGEVLEFLRDVLNKSLPLNAHQLVSGKLHVILTRVHDWKSVAVSEFASKEELIQAITCSCFLPVCFGFLPPKYRGVRYVDGELSMWQANFVSRTTLTVSAFAGEYDICPKDGPAAFFSFQISDCILQISKRNFYRFKFIF